MLTDYITEHGPEIKSQNTLRQACKELAMFWDGLSVNDIKEGTCRAYIEHRNRLYNARMKARGRPGGRISNAMVGRELRVLKAAVNLDYYSGRLIEPHPVWTPKETSKPRKIPERRDVLLMARRARGHVRKFILLAYYTGQRKHTILALRWASVHDKFIDFTNGREKTAKRGGIIPIPSRLKTFLSIWRKRSTPFRHVVEFKSRPVADIKKGFGSAAGDTEFTPYSLRHASIIRMIRAGVNTYEVAKWHQTSIKVIEDSYGHYKPDYFEKAREAK